MVHYNERFTVQTLRRIIIEHLRKCSHCRERGHDPVSAVHVFQALAPVTVGPEILVGIWQEIAAAVEAELTSNRGYSGDSRG